MVLGWLGRWTGVSLALGAALYGCLGGQADNSAQQPPRSRQPTADPHAPKPGSLELELVTKPWVELAFGERETIAVRLIDASSREPIAGARVSFALLGRSRDSSLAQVDAVTSEDGVAENDLIAGEMAAAFSVRITAPGAYEVTVEAGVSSAGFGTLTVSAPYDGPRHVLRQIVFAQANMDCARAERMSGDPMATFDSTHTARFAALPAEVSYALLALAEGAGGQVLARGCQDGVVVRADRQVTVTVEFEDEPLLVSGRFTLDATLDARTPAATLGDAVHTAAEMAVLSVTIDGENAVQAERADARFLLDSLNSTLRSADDAVQPGGAELADALAQARAMGHAPDGPEHTLDAQLELNGEGALREAIDQLVDYTAKDMSTLHLVVELQVDEDDGELPLTWQPVSLEALPETGTPVRVELGELEAVETRARFVTDRDAVELERVRFAAPLGALTSQVLHRVMSFDATGHGEALRAAVGCATLAAWLAEQSFAADGACGESCVNAACDRAVRRLVSAAQTALVALDESRPTLAVYGELDLQDDDGDLLAEQMSTDALLCEWEAADEDTAGDSFSGFATATAAP